MAPRRLLLYNRNLHEGVQTTALRLRAARIEHELSFIKSYWYLYTFICTLLLVNYCLALWVPGL